MDHHRMESQRSQLYQTGTAVEDGVRLISIMMPTSPGVEPAEISQGTLNQATPTFLSTKESDDIA